MKIYDGTTERVNLTNCQLTVNRRVIVYIQLVVHNSLPAQMKHF